MNITILDIIIIVLFIIAIVLGFKKGILKELVSFIGTIIIFIISYQLKGIVGNFLCIIFPFYIKDLVTVNIMFYQIIAFILTFGILSFLFNLFINLTKTIDNLLDKIKLLNIPLRILGAIISVFKMYLTVFILLLLVMIPFRNTSIVKKSLLTERIVYETPILSKGSKEVIFVLEEIIILDRDIAKGKITINEGNLKILDLLLKYNMIDKDTVIDLYNKDKIRGIEDIETVVLNY